MGVWVCVCVGVCVCRGVCVCVCRGVCVCVGGVCVCVISFLPPYTCRPQNIGTYGFIATWENCYNLGVFCYINNTFT